MKRFKVEKQYLYWGVTAFAVVAAAIVFYLFLNRLPIVREALHKMWKILSPFVWGLVIAYLLCPLLQIYQRVLFLPLAKRIYRNSPKAETAVPKLAQGLAILLSVLSLLVFLAGLIWMVAPQLYSSVENIVVNSQNYIDTADRWVAKFFTRYPEVEAAVSSAVGDISDGLVAFATNNLLPRISGLLSGLTSGVVDIAKGVYNVLIGIIVSVYVLNSRQVFSAHGKKLLYSVFSLNAAEKILSAIRFTDQVFIGFISGKILDSLIIGIMCYVGCAIMRIEYAVLASFVVGLTNVIPFFGPLFGMIIGTPIILMESPVHAVEFLIFVILLQQFDGNFLGPKILGNSVGIGGFWVLFSIIVGSGLFGFAGMLLGVPVFVVIYAFCKSLVNRKLARSGLPVETEQYRRIDHIDPATGTLVELEDPEGGAAARRRKMKKKEETAKNAVPSDAVKQEENRSQR